MVYILSQKDFLCSLDSDNFLHIEILDDETFAIYTSYKSEDQELEVRLNKDKILELINFLESSLNL